MYRRFLPVVLLHAQEKSCDCFRQGPTDCSWVAYGRGRREEARHSLTIRPAMRRNMCKTTGDCHRAGGTHRAGEIQHRPLGTAMREPYEVGRLAVSIRKPCHQQQGPSRRRLFMPVSNRDTRKSRVSPKSADGLRSGSLHGNAQMQRNTQQSGYRAWRARALCWTSSEASAAALSH